MTLLESRVKQDHYRPDVDRLSPADWDIDSARIMLGVDLIVVYGVDFGREEVHRVNHTRSEYLSDDEGRRIEATVRAFDGLSYFDWTQVLDDLSRFYRVQRCSMFSRDDLLPEMAGSLDANLTPYAGLVGCRPGPAHDGGMHCMYAAVWANGGYEALYPLTQAAQAVDQALSLATLTTPRGVRQGDRFVRDEVEELRLGDQVTIPLRHPLPRLYDRETRTSFLAGLSPAFSGRGDDPGLAHADLVRQVNTWLQRLYRTRPINRTEQQDRVWRLLCRFLNIQAYRDSIPMRLFRTGTITGAPSEAERVVVWEEDSREDRIRLSQAPEQFATWPVSQRFEAMVYYDRNTRSLDHIDDAERIEPAASAEQAWQFWDSIPRDPAPGGAGDGPPPDTDR